MDKKKKDTWIFRMYMAVGTLGVIGAIFYDTILQCVILLLVSAFTFWCGYIIKKHGTDNSDWNDDDRDEFG